MRASASASANSIKSRTDLTILSCRNYRLEIRTPDGNRRYYSIRAKSKREARVEAENILKEMIQSFGDERFLWRMAGDRNWSFGMRQSQPFLHTFLKKITNYFFE